MDVALAVLADFANSSADGKLNILGIFDTVYAEQYPAAHPEMKLVVRFGIHPAEIGQKKHIEIQLRTDQGQRVFRFTVELDLIEPKEGQRVPAGEMITTDSILGINGLRIDAAGTYEFVILVNGEVKASVPLKAVLRPRS
jgi:hypothetical protein